jgi:hypothetical protein
VGEIAALRTPGGRPKPAIRKNGPHPRPKNPKGPLPRFFPHELARSPKRRLRTEGLALAGLFGAVHPGNPKYRLMVLLSNCGASQHGLAGVRMTEHFQSLCCDRRGRQRRARPRLVQALAEPLHDSCGVTQVKVRFRRKLQSVPANRPCPASFLTLHGFRSTMLVF